MTNDLFRDLLDGRIPMAAKPKPPTIEDAVQRFAEAIGEPIRNIIGIFEKIAEAFTGADMQSNYALVPAPPPADPRARALWAKEKQGHGPKDAPLRNRGRVTRYQTKG